MADASKGFKTSFNLSTKPFTISPNGPDNIGKTSRLALLPDHFTVSKVGGLHENDEMIGRLQQQGNWKNWWWDSSPDDFVCTIFGAVARRYRDSTVMNADSNLASCVRSRRSHVRGRRRRHGRC